MSGHAGPTKDLARPADEFYGPAWKKSLLGRVARFEAWFLPSQICLQSRHINPELHLNVI